MVEVVVCGPASWNQIVYLDHLPDPVPHMQFATRHYETLGGTSAGKALHLHDLGRAARLHTLVGDDAAGSSILGALEGAGVPVAADVVAGPSERHLNLMDPAGGRVSLYLSTTGLPRGDGRSLVESWRGARAVVLDLSSRARELVPPARDLDVPVWTDLHDYDGRAEFHRPFVEAASYVFMNADGIGEPVDFMRRTVEEGARTVVCTLGADGAVAVDAELGVLRVPATPVAEIVDTNGAGDGFMAGFLAATLDGMPTDKALEAGARQAARALTTPHLSPLLDPLAP